MRVSQNSHAASAGSASASASKSVSYTVRRGDTLSRIATVFQVSVAELLRWNSISGPSSIRPGQKLTVRIPGRT